MKVGAGHFACCILDLFCCSNSNKMGIFDGNNKKLRTIKSLFCLLLPSLKLNSFFIPL